MEKSTICLLLLVSWLTVGCGGLMPRRTSPPDITFSTTRLASPRGADFAGLNSELYFLQGARTISGVESRSLPQEGSISLASGDDVPRNLILFRNQIPRSQKAEINLAIIEADCKNLDRTALSRTLIPPPDPDQITPTSLPRNPLVYVAWEEISWRNPTARSRQFRSLSERIQNRLDTECEFWRKDDLLGLLNIELVNTRGKIKVLPYCEEGCDIIKIQQDADAHTAHFGAEFEPVEGNHGFHRIEFQVAMIYEE